MSELDDAAQGALEHAGAAALTAQAGADARAAGRHASDDLCSNCGAELQGGFCHVCGQAAHSLRRPVWSLIGEALETLFAFDGRFRRTVPDLMVRPGRVTRAYLDGRRARFLPPFRLYILASLVFFVLLPLVAGGLPSFQAPPGLDAARTEIERAHAAGELTGPKPCRLWTRRNSSGRTGKGAGTATQKRMPRRTIWRTLPRIPPATTASSNARCRTGWIRCFLNSRGAASSARRPRATPMRSV